MNIFFFWGKIILGVVTLTFRDVLNKINTDIENKNVSLKTSLGDELVRVEKSLED